MCSLNLLKNQKLIEEDNSTIKELGNLSGDFISITGTVFRLYLGCLVYRRPITDVKGYFKVKIKGKNVFVHRLVVTAFMGGVPDGKQVNHKNGNKKDNRLENLELVTPRENVRHAWETGLCGKKDSRKMRGVAGIRLSSDNG